MSNSTFSGSPSKKKKPMTRPLPKSITAAHGTLSLEVDNHPISTATGSTTNSNSSSHYTNEAHSSRPPLRMTAASHTSMSSSSSGSSSSVTSGSAIHHFSHQASLTGGARSLSTTSSASCGRPSPGTAAYHHTEAVGDHGYFEHDNDGEEVSDDRPAGDQQQRDRRHAQNSRRQQRRRGRRRRSLSDDSNSSDTVRKPGLYGKAHIKGRYKLVRMVLLTTSLMGLQFTWAVEMAYGTPFLLQLGLSKSLMSLVWLAGPLSGLVMQPIVGVLSDRCTSRFGRRRPFLAIGVAAVVCSFLCLGWCREIMTFVFGADYPGLDVVTILMAVASIYILDFAINCVQASCRTLIVDSLPSSQQEEAAAWASRLMGLGGIFGYFMGNVNLPEVLPAFGDTQIKGLCIVACLFLILNVGLTCWAVTERVMVRSTSSSGSSFSEFLGGFMSIIQSIRHLPLQIQRLCNVQFFAWMGWFPFLFYSSTYIAEIYTRENQADQDNSEAPSAELNDAAVRAGSYCLLVYSIISLAASILLPVFVAPAVSSHQHPTASLMSPSSSTPTPATAAGRWHWLFKGQIHHPSLAAWWRRLRPRWLVLPIPWLTLPRMYTLSLALLSFSLVATWLIQDIEGSTILFSMCGIAWAVSMWAPFSILGEVISQQLQEQQHQERMRGSHAHFGGGEGVETIFEADSDGDGHHYDMHGVVVEGDDGQEEIRMVENKRYRPVAVQVDTAYDPPTTMMTSTSAMATQGQSTSEAMRGRTGTPLVMPGSTRNGIDFRDSPHQSHSSSNGTQHRGGHVHGSYSLASIDTVVSESSKEGTLYRRPSDEIQSESDGRDSMEEETVGGDDEEVQKLVQTPGSPSFPASRRREGDMEAQRTHGGGGNGEASSVTSSVGTSAGALLGIHNIYIVLPQFLVSFLSSLVFAAIEGGKNAQEGDGGDAAKVAVGVEGDQPADPNTIGVMLRFGGLMAGIAALLSLRLWRAPALGGRW